MRYLLLLLFKGGRIKRLGWSSIYKSRDVQGSSVVVLFFSWVFWL